jgi:hypothetical protein
LFRVRQSLQENCCFAAVLEGICGGFHPPLLHIATVSERSQFLASVAYIATVFQTAVQTAVIVIASVKNRREVKNAKLIISHFPGGLKRLLLSVLI